MLMRVLSKAAGVAAEAARTSLALVEALADAAAGRLRERSGRSRPIGTPPPPPATSPPRTPTPPRAPRAARPARQEAPAAEPPAPPAAEPAAAPAPIAAVPEPTRGQAARIRAERRAAAQSADGPGPEIRIDEPWPGYKAMNAPEIVDRLRVSDDAVKAVVALYEGSHRKRKTVLRATGAPGSG
jgi:hypothetical protein